MKYFGIFASLTALKLLVDMIQLYKVALILLILQQI